MPLHLSRRVLDRLAQRWFAAGVEGATSDTTFLDFANLLQHRMIALFYRAWADQTPAVQVERDGGGRIRAMLGAMAGADAAALRRAKLDQAAALGHQVLGPERLAGLAHRRHRRAGRDRASSSAPGRRSRARLQSRLGGPNAVLGRGAALGPRVFSRQQRIEVRIGPLGLADYPALPARRRAASPTSASRCCTASARRSTSTSARCSAATRSPTPASAPPGSATPPGWPAGAPPTPTDLRLRAVVGLATEGARAAA